MTNAIKKVLVTGANGYIGSHVVSVLLDLGYEVAASDIRADNIDPRATVFSADIFTEPDPYAAFGKPNALIHLAWRDGFIHQSTAHLQDLPLHYAFIRRMAESGVGSISVMGSMHEIGFYEGMVDENTPANPASLYGISKNALRQALTVLATSVPFSLHWLRGYYILGDDARNHSIFAKLLEKAAAGETLFPFTTGTNRYDFISVDDLALEIALASVQTAETGVINCCSGRAVPLRDVVEDFIAKKGLPIRLQYGAFPDRPYDSRVIYGSAERIRAILEDARPGLTGPVADRVSRLLETIA